ncbi:MAG: A/G-specific adenine glycosylase [Defluviitaleaceae bacterium]|nr:A/G-specific adenine glycosylase [Defluviitaleaceae bacterium]
MNEHIEHIKTSDFQSDLIAWYNMVKRDLPWRENLDPYRILVSEIMLQQTQVATVIPYYHRFMELFPTAEALAHANETDLLKAWEGLGYYSRARNLQASAKMIAECGAFPTRHDDILKLKGVGPYTAGAVASIAFSMPVPAVDGNVFRVISRIGAIFEDIAKPKTRQLFESIVTALISKEYPGDFNQGLMELGATICTPKSPKCLECPIRQHCQAYAKGIDDQLPVKTKPVKQKKIKFVVGVIENEKGQWLIVKRPETGLLANFYEFKQVEYEAGYPEEVLRGELTSNGYQVKQIKDLGFSKHVFTHRIWEMEAYQVIVDASLTTCHENELWINPKELASYSLAIAHVRILESTTSERS